jgi:Uma2 family endonuclease
MSASLRALTLEEFLVWERAQPVRYEFDGTQPIPVGMTGGSTDHERLIARTIMAVGARLREPCEVFASGLKVVTEGRVRYPDVTVACGANDGEDDTVQPRIVFEVLSPSSALTDRRVKAMEYRSVASILAYVILNQERPEATVMRRADGWQETHLAGRQATLSLPEIDVEVPLSALYR